MCSRPFSGSTSREFPIAPPGSAWPRIALRYAALFALFAAQAGCDRERGAGRSASIEIRDDFGAVVRLARPARRIVSLAPNVTEILCSLGLDSALIGVTTYCDYPPSMLGKPKVGDLVAPNIERIVALQPDLVIMTKAGSTRQTYDRLTGLGFAVFVCNPLDLEGVLSSISRCGRLAGAGARARVVCDSLGQVLPAPAAPDTASSPKVIFLISLDPLIIAGKDSFLGEMIARCGALMFPLQGGGSYPVIGREALLEFNPDILLVSNDLRVSRESLLQRFPEWRRLAAFRHGIVEAVDADIFLRPGPRMFTGLQVLERHIRSWKENTGRREATAGAQ